jgi:hypothetical protein
MSQFVVFNGPGSSGGGSVLTLTGNDGLPVSPTLAGNINVVGDNITLSTSRNGANELLITLNNTTANTLTTNDGAYHTIIDYAMNIAGEAVAANGSVVGTRTDGANDYNAMCGGGFTFTARLEPGAGTATLLTFDVSSQANDSSTGNAAFQMIQSGSSILIQVRGEAAETWNWKASINFILV